MQKINVTPFEELSFDFKQLNHSDFSGYLFDDKEKTIIEPNSEGFISDALNNVIDLNKSDTTIINAGVGQGKTTAIIDNFVKYYYQQNKLGNRYKIVIVTPFKTLNKDYETKIINRSNLNDVCFDYQDLDLGGVTNKNYQKFYEKPIQLISVKSILGDAGTVALKQKDIKREYYEFVIEKCKQNDEKVVLIFDEIHESLESFNSLLLPNIQKWKAVTHKVIIASATFSESSKTVIKYLAELTDKKLKIIESKRVQQIDKLSELHLCFYNRFTFKQDDQFIKDLIKEQFEDSKYINILCFSENLSKNIYNSSIGEMIRDHYGTLNLVTGNNDEEFNFEGCNIGTKFKTGISIDEEKTSLFIILPLKFAYTDKDKNPFGVFSDRINSVIQSIARVRNKSKIFVIMPSPDKLIVTENINDNYLKTLSLGYFKFDEKQYQSKYLPLSKQDDLLKRFYEGNRSPIESEIKQVENLSDDIRSYYPKYDIYKLMKGDIYLSSTYDIYGKNLSNYVYWAAWNNQFVNCKLKSIIKVSTYKFSEKNVQNKLDEYFADSFYSDAFFTLNSDKACYNLIRNTLYSNNLLYKNETIKKYESISPYRNSNFEQQLLTFIQRKKIPFNFDFRKVIYPPNGEFYLYKNGTKYPFKKKPLDISISKETYFRICISHSQNLRENSTNISSSEIQIIHSYNTIYKFKDILLNEYCLSDEGKSLLPIDKDFKFKDTHLVELISTFKTLIDNDKVLKSFSTRGLDKDKTIFRFLRDLFFNTKPTTKNAKKMLKINEIIPLLNHSEYVNLIYDYNDAWLNQPGDGIVFFEETNNPFWEA